MKTIKNLKAEEIRKSIIQLAIQGKLVKQDPNDEPASELVKRIYAEKQRLIKEGKIKKDKNESFIFKGDDNCYYEKIGNNAPVKLEDLPFDIPDNWTWIRLKNISDLNGGYAFKSEKFCNDGIRVIRISDFDENGLKHKDIKRYPYSPDLDSYRIIPQDILLCMTGGTVGKSAYIKAIDEDCYINQRVALIRIKNVNTDYFYSVLTSSYISNVINASKTSTNDNISMRLIEDFLIPLPPIEEELRIVDKINSCEPLITQYSAAENRLSILEEEFPDKLKKSILQYAIEGKLVKQDPNDEPASVLLERIKTEKERLIKEGKIKRDKNESYIFQGDDKNYYENFLFYYHSFDIPSGWEICKLAEITEFIHRGKSPVYSSIEEIPVIAQKCNQKDGSLSLEKALFIDPASLCKYDKTKISKPNDIIVNSTGTGTVGRVNILNTSLFEKYQTIVTDSHVTTIRLIENECDPLFIYFYLKSPLIYDHAEERSEGSTNQIELYAKTIMNYCLCLPPKNEQTRISRKISRLLSHL